MEIQLKTEQTYRRQERITTAITAPAGELRFKATEQQSSLYTRFLKRPADLLLAGVLTVGVLSWLTPLLFVIYRLTGSGKLFYTQKRMGFNNRIFTCYKFRTMRPSREADLQQCLANDTRITPVGRLLRVTHIDELPQLINILRGDMSFVGPRPHMLYHDQLFNRLMPGYYSYRHTALPGLTGLAQACGYHGEVDGFFSIYHRTRLDLFYVRQCSFWLDTRIVLKTLVNVLKHGR
jgi:putative colanic acid biosynthesis UDP-glucose lipid carrier transferase